LTGRLLLRPAARADLLDISDYIASDNPAAAERLLAELETKSLLLADQPGIGHRRPDILREDLLCFGVRQYLIFYRLIPEGIEVVRYLHGRRDLKRLL
jgi:toxin ParE1/3/4